MKAAAAIAAMLAMINLVQMSQAQPVPSPPMEPLTGGSCLQGFFDCPFSAPFIPSAPQQASTPVTATATAISVGNLGTCTGILTQANSVAQYNSVPFASSPVRFSPPVNAPMFVNGSHDGTYQTNRCVQGDGSGVETGCLWFEINVPTNTSARPVSGWPVFVYYPGGSFVGTDANSMNNITGSAQNFIGIYGSYRVGPFAYLALKGISKEFGSVYGTEASGAIATLDQQSGLQWVQNYISYFGGDKSRVTVGGESAGSWSVCLLLSSPLSKGLFAQAILESGNCDGGPATLVQTLEHQEQMGEAVAEAAGCGLYNNSNNGNYTQQLACLRAVSAYNLTLANYFAGGEVSGDDHMTTPVLDGYTQVMPPQQAFWSGNWNKVPLLLGSNLFETYIFALAFIQNSVGVVTYDDVSLFLNNYTDSYTCSSSSDCPGVDRAAVQDLKTIFGSTGKFNAAYGSLGPYYALNAAASQGIIQCGMRRLAEYATDAGMPAYLYNYRLRAGGPTGVALGPVHSFEVQFVYGTITDATPDEQQYSYIMQAMWANFVVNGDPSNSSSNAAAVTGQDTTMPAAPLLNLDGSSAPATLPYINWPRYNTSTHTAMQFGDHQVPYNYTLWLENYNTVLPQCPLFDRTMPAALNHSITAFTPRPYSGYNQPGFNLIPTAEKTRYTAATATPTAITMATSAVTPTATVSPAESNTATTATVAASATSTDTPTATVGFSQTGDTAAAATTQAATANFPVAIQEPQTGLSSAAVATLAVGSAYVVATIAAIISLLQ